MHICMDLEYYIIVKFLIMEIIAHASSYQKKRSCFRPTKSRYVRHFRAGSGEKMLVGSLVGMMDDK